MGKKSIVSVIYENERISIKNSLALKCVLRGPRADLWPFYGFLCKQFSLYKGLHILSKVSCFLLKSFHFRRLQKR